MSGTIAHETVAAGRSIAGRVQRPAAVTSLVLMLAVLAVAGCLGMWLTVWSLNRVVSKRLRWW